MRRRPALVLAGALALAACSSSSPNAGTTGSPTTTAVTVPATSATTSGTDARASTTTGEVAAPAEVAPPADPSAWERRDLPAGAVDPCCAEQWYLPPSPPLPAPGAPLPDGVYAAEVVRWWPQAGTEMTMLLQPFVACTESTATRTLLQCEQPYQPGAVGVDLSTGIQVPLTLDEHLTVGYTGFACAPGASEWSSQQWVSTGVGLDALVSQLSSDYDREIAPALNAPDSWGLTDPMILEALAADPDSAFAVEPCGITGAVSWTSPAGPSVLLQTLGSPDRAGAARQPWELLRPATLQVHGGRPTLYLAAGFQS